MSPKVRYRRRTPAPLALTAASPPPMKMCPCPGRPRRIKLLHEMPSPSSDWTARQPHARWVARMTKWPASIGVGKSASHGGSAERRRNDPEAEIPHSFRRACKIPHSTKDKLRQRLTGEMESMVPQTRVANWTHDRRPDTDSWLWAATSARTASNADQRARQASAC